MKLASLMAQLGTRLGKHRVLWWIARLYPPFVGAGIRVRATPGLESIDVELPLTWWNRNYVGTHYGGSLFSMCDPFFMIMLIERLGPDYIVWDKASRIRFRRPGRGRVRAHFHLSDAQVAAIRAEADVQPRTEPTLNVQVVDDHGEVIAEVERTLHVRRKDGPRQASRTEGAA
ncbi:MAG TPA: DUF4442 domain-containing protein [Myxococcaceae bacterium]|nr:DUF4442 domain-containing protein [Myxococcaceae bacterium]